MRYTSHTVIMVCPPNQQIRLNPPDAAAEKDSPGERPPWGAAQLHCRPRAPKPACEALSRPSPRPPPPRPGWKVSTGSEASQRPVSPRTAHNVVTSDREPRSQNKRFMGRGSSSLNAAPDSPAGRTYQHAVREALRGATERARLRARHPPPSPRLRRPRHIGRDSDATDSTPCLYAAPHHRIAPVRPGAERIATTSKGDVGMPPVVQVSIPLGPFLAARQPRMHVLSCETAPHFLPCNGAPLGADLALESDDATFVTQLADEHMATPSRHHRRGRSGSSITVAAVRHGLAYTPASSPASSGASSPAEDLLSSPAPPRSRTPSAHSSPKAASRALQHTI